MAGKPARVLASITRPLTEGNIEMTQRNQLRHRIERFRGASLRNWESEACDEPDHKCKENVVVDCGWGRLIFGQTYRDPQILADTLCKEKPGKRDIAFYLRDPHVVISLAPQEVFLDPSHTYRLWLDQYRPAKHRPKGFPPSPTFVWHRRASRKTTYLVAEDLVSGQIVGTVTGIDHHVAFGDSENGSSLWALAVDTQTAHPGIGEYLVRQLAEHYLARGCAYMDLSVMHNNSQAIALYQKLGFKRVPVFAIKYKNPFNEPFLYR